MLVMLVDDSRTSRNIQRNVLQQIGYTDLLEASDGVDALAKAKSTLPDLILLDWNMPNMDGLTFLKAFRTENKKTPIIMVTTEADKSHIIEAIRAGVNNYVVKPFTPDALSTRIKETLAKITA